MIRDRLPMNTNLGRGMKRFFPLIIAASVSAPPLVPAAEAIDNLDADAVAILRQLPGVAQVTRHGPAGRPSHRVVHLLDWHFVPKDRYAADLRSLSDTPLSDAEVEGHWKELLREVAAVQAEQLVLLGRLVQHHGLRRIHMEGLTSRDMPIFDAKVAALRKVGAELAELRDLVEDLGEEDAGGLVGQLEAFEQRQHRDLLQLGAAGRLFMAGKIKAIAPLEEVASLRFITELSTWEVKKVLLGLPCPMFSAFAYGVGRYQSEVNASRILHGEFLPENKPFQRSGEDSFERRSACDEWRPSHVSYCVD